MSVTHSTVATLPDEAGKEVNKDEWNAAHTVGDGSFVAAKLSATAACVFGATAAGNGAEIGVTGTGDAVLATSPTLVTPALGTPASGTLTNCTGLPQAGTVGLTTADSPEFAAVNVGHASDTTIARPSAGDISVEGNIVYRAGGTDVPVTDGGTGASAAIGACANLAAVFILGKSAASSSGAADTNENVLATITVPAGAMGVNGALKIKFATSHTNNANNKTYRVRLGGISGTAFLTHLFTATVRIMYELVIQNDASASAQKSYRNAITSAASNNVEAFATGVINTASAQDIVITAQKATGTDTMTLEMYTVELLSDGA